MAGLPAGILRNTSAERFHPIFFRIAPRPSDEVYEGAVVRHKSHAHHTTGFATKAQARAFIGAQAEYCDCGLVWEWDGKVIPIQTIDFKI